MLTYWYALDLFVGNKKKDAFIVIQFV